MLGPPAVVEDNNKLRRNMAFNFQDYNKSDLVDESLLFHYTSSKTALKYILQTNTIKFATRKHSHDPIEKEELVFTSTSLQSQENMSDDEDYIKSTNYINLINKARNTTKYACFCIDKGIIIGNKWNKGAFKSRMWSQYANKHKGICIVLNKETMVENVNNYISNFPLSFPLSGPVVYNNEHYLSVNKFHVSTEVLDINNPIQYLKKSTKEFFFTKIKDYENEQEYRICIYNTNKKAEYISIANAIQGVIIGQYCSNQDKKKIVDLCSIRNIPIIQAWWFRGMPDFIEV